MFIVIIQTILVAFSMNTSRACSGMLSSENDDFKFLKTAKSKKHVHRVHHSFRAHGTVYLSVDQKHKRKIGHRIVFYISQNIEI